MSGAKIRRKIVWKVPEPPIFALDWYYNRFIINEKETLLPGIGMAYGN
jgi:hypothetical protein